MKISIILPVFNVQKYIEYALCSILEQNIENMEIIVVNDGSTDKSMEIINNIKDPRIKVVNNKKNYGLSESRNIGLKKSSGDIIYFMDSDDEIRPNLFKTVIDQFHNDPKLDMVCFNFEKINHQIAPQKLENVQLKWAKTINSQEALMKLMDGSIAVTAWSYMVKKKFLDKINFSFTSGKLFEDMNTTSYLLSKANKINISYLLPSPYLYLQRENSIMGKNKNVPSDAEVNDSFFMLMSEYEIIKSKLGDTKEVNQWLFNLLLYYYFFYYRRIRSKKKLKKYSVKIMNIVQNGKLEIGLKNKIKLIVVRFPELLSLQRIVNKIIK